MGVRKSRANGCATAWNPCSDDPRSPRRWRPCPLDAGRLLHRSRGTQHLDPFVDRGDRGELTRKTLRRGNRIGVAGIGFPGGDSNVVNGTAWINFADFVRAHVRQAIERLEQQWPGLRDRLCEPGPSLRRHIHVYVDQERASLETPLDRRSRVDVIAAISGG